MEEKKKVCRSRGDVIAENIKVGDIHYEFEYNLCIKCEVITEPVEDPEGHWEWKSKNVNTGNIIEYGMSAENSHYNPKLYTYEAYQGCKYI